MNFVKNIKLSIAVPLIAIIPLLVALGFGGYEIKRDEAQSSQLSELITLFEMAALMGDLVHEQQKERGYTATFLNGQNGTSNSDLQAQRTSTDAKRAEFNEYVETHAIAELNQRVGQKVKAIQDRLDKLATIRDRVDNRSIELTTALDYYTELNAMNVKAVAALAQLSDDGPIVEQIVAYSIFLTSKDVAGIERAVGAAGLAADRVTAELIGQIDHLVKKQNLYLEVFRTHAPVTQVEALAGLLASNEMEALQQVRDTLLAGRLSVAANGLTAEEWFSKATAKINKLKAFEDTLTAELREAMQTKYASAHDAMLISIAVLVAVFILLGAAITVLVRSINQSIRELTSAMVTLAGGDLEVKLPTVTTNEVGQMASALYTFRDNGLEIKRLNAEQIAKDLAAKDTQRQQTLAMANQFEERVGGIVQEVATSIGALSQIMQALIQASQRTESECTIVASAAEESTVGVDSMAQAMQEMSSTVQEISQQVESVARSSQQAVAKTDDTAREVQELSDNADRIGEIVALISDIAEQTNLLALNATIEAARAGEAGRGFAVVAAEVKALATQTAKATVDIKLQIGNIQGSTNKTVSAISAIRSTIGEVDSSANVVAAAVAEQDATANTIASSLREVAEGSSDVSRSCQSLISAADATNGCATDIGAAVEQLSQYSQSLDKQVKTFLAEVRSAA